jgi:hypothetical protein
VSTENFKKMRCLRFFVLRSLVVPVFYPSLQGQEYGCAVSVVRLQRLSDKAILVLKVWAWA